MKGNRKLREERRAYAATLPKPYFRTALGAAYCGKAEELLPCVADESVDLIFTSPPCALLHDAEYARTGLSKKASCSRSTHSCCRPWTGKLVINASIIGWRRSSLEPTW